MEIRPISFDPRALSSSPYSAGFTKNTDAASLPLSYIKKCGGSYVVLLQMDVHETTKCIQSQRATSYKAFFRPTLNREYIFVSNRVLKRQSGACLHMEHKARRPRLHTTLQNLATFFPYLLSLNSQNRGVTGVRGRGIDPLPPSSPLARPPPSPFVKSNKFLKYFEQFNQF